MQQLIKLFLEVKQQSRLISKLTDEIKLLKENYKKLESEISVSKTVSSLFTEQMNHVERQCCTNAQYSRRECLEVVGIPSSVNINDLEGEVCTFFNKICILCMQNRFRCTSMHMENFASRRADMHVTNDNIMQW